LEASSLTIASVSKTAIAGATSALLIGRVKMTLRLMILKVNVWLGLFKPMRCGWEISAPKIRNASQNTATLSLANVNNYPEKSL
jgi:hypothetical protein